MMRITTLCSAFILSILSLSLLRRNQSRLLHFRLTLCSLPPEVIKPAKTVKPSAVVAKARVVGS